MPQPAQHLLTRVFLLWISVLSIIQVVFIVLYFTSGPYDKSKDYSAKAAPLVESPKANNQSQSDSNGNLKLGKGTMATFKGRAGNGTIKWSPYIEPGVVSVNNSMGVLTIEKDGYYFLNLQVTLKTNMCQQENQSNPKVSVIYTNESKKRTETLLEGHINRVTCTTGLLARVAQLSSKGTLVVTINIQTPKINDTDSVTHLDIIYLSLK